MAWTAATQWELRTTGTTTGGGGFDASFGGVDYSQQDNPQLTHTDGVISGTNVQSTAGGFTTQMKGNGIFLSGPAVWRQITAFVDANNVTIDAAPGNSSGNTYHVGGAWLPTASGFNVPYVAGNKLWMGPGTYGLISNSLSINVSGTSLLPITIEGYSVTRGDGIPAAIIQFVGSDAIAVTLNGAFQILKSVTIDGQTNTSDCMRFSVVSVNCQMIGCKIIKGHGNQVNFVGNSSQMSDCEVDGTNNTGASGFGQVLVTFATQGNVIDHCHIHNGPANTHLGAVTDSGDMTTIQYNVIRNHGVHGLRLACPNFGKLIEFNDIWNCAGNGIHLENFGVNFDRLLIRYNIVGKSTGYDVEFNGADQSTVFGTQQWAAACLRFNAFYTTGTARYHNVPTGFGDIVLTTSPFTDDTTTHDFTLNATAGGGAACIGAGSETWVDGVNVTKYTLGAMGSPGAIPPTAPTNLVATVVSATNITLVWTDNSTDEIYFDLERQVDGGGYSSIALLAPNTVSYSDTGVTANHQYQYRVKALN